MTPREKWWQAIGFALDTEQDVFAAEMLKGFNLMYGGEEAEGAKRPNAKRAGSPLRRRDERPRTELLIIGDDGEEEVDERIGKPLSGLTLMPLTPYFENRVKTLKAYVPMTVFDAGWIKRDHRAAGTKKVKTLKEGSWIDAIDLFIKYLEEEYDRPKAAKMFTKHKENVVKVKKLTKCWMVALRYDMKVRLIVMKVKKVKGKRVMEDAGFLHDD
ncbi:uncharacterized protein MELLADRAFT_57333, partial [Melampsora larici-populina 98AG31]